MGERITSLPSERLTIVVDVVGPAASGKTTILADLVQELRERFDHVIFFSAGGADEIMERLQHGDRPNREIVVGRDVAVLVEVAHRG